MPIKDKLKKVKDLKNKLPKIEKVKRKDYDEVYEKLIRIAKICVYERSFFEREYIADGACLDSMYSVLNSILFTIKTFYGPAYCAEAKVEIDMTMEDVINTLRDFEQKNDTEAEKQDETDICETT